MNNRKRLVLGGGKKKPAKEAPASLIPVTPGSTAETATRHTAVSKSWMEKREMEKALGSKKPAPEGLEKSPTDEGEERFFETMTTCRLPNDPAKSEDDALIGMPLGEDQIIDCRAEEDREGLPLGWRGDRAASPPPEPYQKHSFTTASGPPGQGLPKGASPSVSAISESSPPKPDSGLRDEKTKEFFPPQLNVSRRVSHTDVLKKDIWEEPHERPPDETTSKAQNPKRTILGIPFSWKH